MMIHELKNEGLSISEIARKLGINRKTVRKYLQCDRNDVAAVKRQPRASKLDSYRPYLCARLCASIHSCLPSGCYARFGNTAIAAAGGSVDLLYTDLVLDALEQAFGRG